MISAFPKSPNERQAEPRRARRPAPQPADNDTSDGSDYVRLNVNMPREMHRQFKAKAAAEGMFMGDLIRDYVTDYLQDEPPSP